MTYQKQSSSPPLEKKLSLRIRQDCQTPVLLGWFHFAREELKVVVSENVGRDDLNLSGGKKTPWACPKPMTKIDVIGTSRGMLIFELVAGFLPLIVKAEGVESRRIGV